MNPLDSCNRMVKNLANKENLLRGSIHPSPGKPRKDCEPDSYVHLVESGSAHTRFALASPSLSAAGHNEASQAGDFSMSYGSTAYSDTLLEGSIERSSHLTFEDTFTLPDKQLAGSRTPCKSTQIPGVAPEVEDNGYSSYLGGALLSFDQSESTLLENEDAEQFGSLEDLMKTPDFKTSARLLQAIEDFSPSKLLNGINNPSRVIFPEESSSSASSLSPFVNRARFSATSTPRSARLLDTPHTTSGSLGQASEDMPLLDSSLLNLNVPNQCNLPSHTFLPTPRQPTMSLSSLSYDENSQGNLYRPEMKAEQSSSAFQQSNNSISSNVTSEMNSFSSNNYSINGCSFQAAESTNVVKSEFMQLITLSSADPVIIPPSNQPVLIIPFQSNNNQAKPSNENLVPVAKQQRSRKPRKRRRLSPLKGVVCAPGQNVPSNLAPSQPTYGYYRQRVTYCQNNLARVIGVANSRTIVKEAAVEDREVRYDDLVRGTTSAQLKFLNEAKRFVISQAKQTSNPTVGSPLVNS